jgi:hypothetical protein
MPVARRAAIFALVATLALSSAAAAQVKATGFAQSNQAELGPQIGYGSNSTKFFIGAQFAYPIVNRLDIYPQFQYYFPGNSVHIWSLSGNVRYWPKLNIANSGLYAGGGLDYTHTSVSVAGISASNSDVGLSLLGGWQFYTKSKMFPFAQVRVVIGDADRVEFGGGINFRI